MVLPKPVHLHQPVHHEFTGQESIVPMEFSGTAIVNVFSGSASSLHQLNSTQHIGQ